MAAQAALTKLGPKPAAAVDWDRMAARAHSMRRAKAVVLRLPDRRLVADPPALFLAVIIAFSRTGVAETLVLWRSMLVLVPAVIAFWLAVMLRETAARCGSASRRSGSSRRSCSPCWSAPTCTSTISYSWSSRISRRSYALASGSARRGPVPQRLERLRQFDPDRRCADGHRRDGRFARRLLSVALPVPGRASMLRSLLVLHAFPVLTLIVPMFLMLYWIGLLDTLFGVILVLVAFELPLRSSS